MPSNVASGPEKLGPAPTGPIEDTPDWTELPKQVGDAFGGVARGKFQAFGAMKRTTVQVELKAAPDERAVYKALDASVAFMPAEYSVVLNIYAPGPDGKLRFHGYEWEPLSGRLSRKSASDASQGWNDAITAVTDGSAIGITPDQVHKIGAGQAPPPLLK
jgi:hypothetical protein